ncbi:nitroreductase family protein [Cupriavidus sp. 30B13]|uniref:nitroreductase family protein n=1 Tax=Cupriavidus sp. 30B13 TaxID=3384241 RepID=UPI003B914C91
MSQPRSTEHDIHPLFLQRWSPRAFTGEPVDPATLLRFFEAARWAPSGYNAQPWRFVYGRRDTPAWEPIFGALSEYNQGWARGASALVAILSRKVWIPPGKSEPQDIATHSFDAGAAWASLAFQATLAGWHAHGIGGFDKTRLREALAVPDDYAIEAVVAIGKRGDKAQLPEALQAREQPNQRLPLAQLVAEGRFAFEDQPAA